MQTGSDFIHAYLICTLLPEDPYNSQTPSTFKRHSAMAAPVFFLGMGRSHIPFIDMV